MMMMMIMIVVARRQDVQQFAAEGLAVLFAAIYTANKASILETHCFDELRELADEIRAHLIADRTKWRHRQRSVVVLVTI